MRIHLLNNLLNSHYFFARALRKVGVEAHLYFDSGSDITGRPESDDASLAGNYPDWIHEHSLQNRPPTGDPYDPPPLHFMQEISNCDLLHAADVSLVWAMYTGKPYIWYPYGRDLYEYPFMSLYWHPYVGNDPANIVRCLRFRAAIDRCDGFYLGSWGRLFSRGIRLGEQLGLGARTFRIQFGVDEERFSPGKATPIAKLFEQHGISYNGKGPVILHPTRMLFTNRQVGQKGNDRLFRALAQLRGEGFQFTLVVVRQNSQDEGEAEKLFGELGLSDSVVWVPLLPRRELIEWFRASDIVADQFIEGGLGSLSLEALQTGKPLLTSMLTEHQDRTFFSPQEAWSELPPILNASTEEEIYRELRTHLNNPTVLEVLGKRSRDWALKYISLQAVGTKLRDTYEEILSRRKWLEGQVSGFSPSRMQIEPEERKEAFVHFNDAQRRLCEGDLPNAQKALMEAIDCVPYDTKILSAFMNSYQRLFGVEKTIELYLGVLSLIPDDVDLAAELVKLLLAHSRPEALPGILAFVYRHNPDNAALRVEIGRLYFEHGMYEMAIEESTSALEIEPSSLEAAVLRIRALLALRRVAEGMEAATSLLDLVKGTQREVELHVRAPEIFQKE